MHRLHYGKNHPPHDTLLYDTLKVKPNATAAEIVTSYRKLSREYHPDKLMARRNKRRREQMTQHMNDSHEEEKEEEEKYDDYEEEEAERIFTQIREAYEVLKDDSTRLPYHRYGLIDDESGATAVAMLTGGSNMNDVVEDNNFMSEERRQRQQRLLCLMGYGPVKYTGRGRHEQRVMYIAANLIERIRPIVEGTISQDEMSHDIAAECDALKSLPLGAQILRCLGRAYRHSGQRALRRHEWLKKKKDLTEQLLGSSGHYDSYHGIDKQLSMKVDLSDSVRDKFRNAKHLFTAAAASGKLVWTEQVASMSQKRKSNRASIQYHLHDEDMKIPGEEYDGLIDSDADIDNFSTPTEEDVQEQERMKAQKAMINALQVEALWKITKIELDRTIQEACNMILEGRYFFFPSHHGSRERSGWNMGGDGWVVGSTGEVVDADVGRLRAAAALVLMGDIFVRCSKEGTSWVD